MTPDIYQGPIPEVVWEQLNTEFGLPSLDRVRTRLARIHEDPEQLMRQLVRVFFPDGVYCPGFQFRNDLSLNPVVLALFTRALELKIPHNYFAAWMITKCPVLRNQRPVDLMSRVETTVLISALERSLMQAIA
ncbi:hypothetical protein NicSoilE8_38130 [Arthrobacter sp. NicSoilE8]|nr:hypothetical protein NicSoilE8_38130 [Arthrobacter sp. NicSoilE8]